MENILSADEFVEAGLSFREAERGAAQHVLAVVEVPTDTTFAAMTIRRFDAARQASSAAVVDTMKERLQEPPHRAACSRNEYHARPGIHFLDIVHTDLEKIKDQCSNIAIFIPYPVTDSRDTHVTPRYMHKETSSREKSKFPFLQNTAHFYQD